MESLKLLSSIFQLQLLGGSNMNVRINTNSTVAINLPTTSKPTLNVSESIELKQEEITDNLDRPMFLLGCRYYESTSENLAKKPYMEEFEKIISKLEQELKSGKGLNDTTVMEDLGSSYNDMRKSIINNFEGDELKQQLSILNEVYDETAEIISGSIASKITYAYSMHYWRQAFFNSLSDSSRVHIFGKQAMFKDESIEENPPWKLQAKIAQGLMQIAEKAKQYFLDGNKKPITEEEKQEFENYVSKDSDGSLSALSYKNAKDMVTVIDKIENANRQGLKNISSSLNTYGFSDEIKSILYGVGCSREGHLDYLEGKDRSKMGLFQTTLERLKQES